jgi:hypothetical protein
MALLMKIEVGNTGVDVEYWKVTQVNVNWLTNTAHVVVEGFVNEQLRLAGKSALVGKQYDFTADTMPFTVEDNMVAKMYDYLHNETQVAQSNDAEGKTQTVTMPGIFAEAVDLIDAGVVAEKL